MKVHVGVERGSELIAKVITGVQFKNGVEVSNQSRQKVAA